MIVNNENAHRHLKSPTFMIERGRTFYSRLRVSERDGSSDSRAFRA